MTDPDPRPRNGRDAVDGLDDATDPGDLDDLLDAIHDELAATQELPVERSAARWIGEAEAVAADLAEADLAEPVVAERLGHVEELLAEVEATGDDAADEHIDRATSATARALEALGPD